MTEPVSLLEFWNDRAKLQSQAGSNDTVAKSIEIEELVRHFGDGMSVAEFGCGNGITALELARRYNLTVDAFDFSPEMISEAQKLAGSVDFGGRVSFAVSDIRQPAPPTKLYDVVFTERMVINLPDWAVQLEAINTLASYLKPAGRLLMMENSSTGLGVINHLRASAGLAAIKSPWHNRYLDDAEVAAANVAGCRLVDVIPYSATYYFLSRVVNAWLAKESGVEPDYNSKVNQLARLLPAVGDSAQGKLWIWERIA